MLLFDWFYYSVSSWRFFNVHILRANVLITLYLSREKHKMILSFTVEIRYALHGIDLLTPTLTLTMLLCAVFTIVQCTNSTSIHSTFWMLLRYICLATTCSDASLSMIIASLWWSLSPRLFCQLLIERKVLSHTDDTVLHPFLEDLLLLLSVEFHLCYEAWFALIPALRTP